jgi:hypothetical protein
MMTRRHATAECRSSAVWSRCGRYRYCLTRQWDGGGQRLLTVMLNPSTASELRNDPTVARCERRARKGGFGALRVVNLFAHCATDPRGLRAAPDPVGPGNDGTLGASLLWADAILCAWGGHGGHLGRAATVAARLRTTGLPLLHLGLTREGHPRHPLYVAAATPLLRWD